MSVRRGALTRLILSGRAEILEIVVFAEGCRTVLARTLNDLIEARAAELHGIADDRLKLAALVSAVCGVGMLRDEALDAEERLADQHAWPPSTPTV
jgi:hypothetical protein